MKLPEDITAKIDEFFPDNEENSIVRELIAQIYRTSLNVGHDQLARSILFIASGDITEMKRIIDCDFYGDPRDVIIAAEHKAGNPGHYFLLPFNEL